MLVRRPARLQLATRIDHTRPRRAGSIPGCILRRTGQMGATDGPGPFGVLLLRYRMAAGLSQEDLAERAGLSRRGISDLERGARRAPHPATARAASRGP